MFYHCTIIHITNSLFIQQTLLFIKAIKHFRPKTASFENVPGLVLEDFKGYLQSVVANLLRMDYQVRVKLKADAIRSIC